MAKLKRYSESTKKERIVVLIFASIFFSFFAWIVAVKLFHGLPELNRGKYLLFVMQKTYQLQDLRLLAVVLIPPVLFTIMAYFMKAFRADVYTGEKFKKFLRGTQMVSPETMKNIARESKDSKYQLTIAGIPIPFSVEALHFLENGSTGTGKSVAIKEVVNCIQHRKVLYTEHNQKVKSTGKGKTKQLDRMVVIDPNGDLYSLFANPKKDILLNPFDKRTKGWNLFNEIKTEYDYDRFGFSIVPRAEGESEKWNSYARLLLKECMKYVHRSNDKPTLKDVQHMATVMEDGELKKLLAGTDAEAMFVKGADKALGSARFTLSDRLPAFNLMPDGDFSILDALKDESTVGDIYITWREDQVEALKPLITTFADIFISGMLSLAPSKTRSIFVFLDELASMDAISSLRAGLEKGRKHGLKIFAGVQSVKQLSSIYGQEQSIILMSNFRNLVVLGGASTDPETSEFMSKAIGDMEVLRENVTRSSGNGGSTSRNTVKATERVILPSEIASLPILYLLIKFAGELPVTRTKLIPIDLAEKNKGFEARDNEVQKAFESKDEVEQTKQTTQSDSPVNANTATYQKM